MQYGRALKFPLEDSGWLSKVGLGSLIGLVPIANVAQAGYGLEVTRRVAGGDTEELPRWSDFGRFWTKGLALGAAMFVVALPAVILTFMMMAQSAGAFMTMTLAAQADPVLGASAAQLSPHLGAGFYLMLLLLLAYGLFVALYTPAATLRYAVTDSWISMFDFGWIFGYIRRNLGSYLAMLVVLFFLALGLGLVVGVLQLIPFVGIIVSIVFGFWMLLVYDHLLGQLAREAPPA